MDVALSRIRHAFQLPRVNWNLVRDWVENNVAVSDQTRAWSTLAHQWLEAVDLALGETHRAIRSDHVILFAPTEFEQAVSLFDLAESGLKEMASLLGPLARQNQTGPLVIMLFGDDESYCRYVSPFDPEIEFVRSAGFCFKGDFVHVALRPAVSEQLQQTLLHEIAHACLSDRNLPLWLEEGITQLAEEAAVANWARFSLSSEDAAKLRLYWREHPVSDFWWGHGFHTPDEGQRHCYQLAQILFRQIVSDHRKELPEFLSAASAADAGDNAARKILRVSIAEIASQFLGAGNWEPIPPDAAAFVVRGSFLLDVGNTDQAFVDFDRAIELEGQSFDAFFHRGEAFYWNHQLAKSISDFERAIELNPTDYHARNNLAWILATCPDVELRNGSRAVELANTACERVGFSIWYCLGTLAAAHAEAGDFEQACYFAQESLHLAPEAEASNCQARLKSYQADKPWREPLPA